MIQAIITWKQCAGLPTGLHRGKTTFNGMIYHGGGLTYDNDQYFVYCYDPSLDKWTTLPPLPVRYFGLGRITGKLVAVGGRTKSDNRDTDEVYTFEEQSQTWKQTIPPMPTARSFTDVSTLQSVLVVAGGHVSPSYTTAVEIFKQDTSQWYRTDPLPTACCHLSLVTIGDTCYALGGFKSPSSLNQALYASVGDLLCNAVPASQTTHSGSSVTQSAWKTLPNTPTYGPAAAVLASSLLAIGGQETTEGGAAKKEVYMYSPSTNSWIYISDLPAPRSGTAVIDLSSAEILVIGGWTNAKMNTVYMGTLYLKAQ